MINYLSVARGRRVLPRVLTLEFGSEAQASLNPVGYFGALYRVKKEKKKTRRHALFQRIFVPLVDIYMFVRSSECKAWLNPVEL